MSAVPAWRLLRILLLFFALTLPLAWLWDRWGQEQYMRFLWALREPLYDAVGLRPRRGSPVGPRPFAIVSFVALMVVTPGMSWRRRVVGSLVGLAVIAGFHLLFLTVSDVAYTSFGRSRRALTKIVPFLLINDGIPFLVWLFLARDFLRQLVPAFGEAAPRTPAPRGRR